MQGVQAFRSCELAEHPDLFYERAALFYTPTVEIPSQFVGEGPLDVLLRASLPSWLEYFEICGLRSPRFWVDLLQRATGKIRWTPLETPARVTFVNYDSCARGTELLIKPALDCLKKSATGRRDGTRLHYFGAIVDDGWKDICEIVVTEVVQKSSAEPQCRIVVEPADGFTARNITHRIVRAGAEA
ncbi:MAG: hypothetical protein HGA87_07115 [Desulfobulbaceae bacterium]|nr:hypothetical protein [Desulfobulbaceae bacterium]